MTATAESAPALTPKQRQVLRLLEQDKDVGEIAKLLKITRTGVYGHIRKMRRAGVVLPAERASTNGGGPEAAAPAAAPVVASLTDDPEERAREALKSAIEMIEARDGNIEARVEELLKESDALKRERELLGGRRERYTASLAALG